MSRPRPRRVLPFVAVLVTALLALAIPGANAGSVPWYEQSNPQAEDSEVNVTGEPAGGTTQDGEVRGLIDAHTHLMSNEGFGGDIVCGETFSEDGVGSALVDCDSHGSDGRTALIENLTSLEGKGPLDPHSTQLWPSFGDAPKWSSLTHQQMYYRWVERAWRGGQRIMVADAVNNNILCSLPTQVNTHSCNDMDTVRRQVQKTKDLEAFIDARHGGPGKGWFRIAYTPQEARSYIEQGKLAVILGMEISNPFGCGLALGVPKCTKQQIDAGLDEVKNLGIRSMFLCHKFDNALCGVRFDAGTQGVIVNIGNFLNTGNFWQVEQCRTDLHDNTVAGGVVPADIAEAFPVQALPIYPEGPHCNKRGLTGLGEYALRGMMDRGMLVELDHQSVKAAKRTMEVLEAEGYPGVVSSHSWMDKHFTERIYRLGGFVAQYGHDARSFVAEGAADDDLREEYGVGYGFGMDMNGFGGTPPPRADAAEQPLGYPFPLVMGEGSVDRQVTGQRVWDYNTDGVAHYGMVPDWVEDMRTLEGGQGQEVVEDLLRGPESYLRSWQNTASWVPEQDLTKGARPSASSVQWSLGGSFRAGNAIDDRRTTRWAGRWGDDAWWQVEFDTPRQVSRITLDWERAYAEDYRIQVSLDGASWQTVETVRGSDGGIDTIRIDPTSARQVRLVTDTRATGWGVSLHEVTITS
ncbi:discoidin domain-containing protein [Janibacter alittae]|uniref:Discoidin domain-containing protein n=1 Tax=Janibacter alittae TaxID=3115209 RepID=A0ABZ2MH59_9MICO